MKPDWDRIQEIYHQARDLPAPERRAFVEKVCGDDTDLAREVMELLALDDRPFLEPPIEDLPLASADELAGTTVKERYFIERELGYGGMGQVYLARDQRLNNRPVVIKFLAKELLENSYARQKFKQESEALSRIHHAGVVQVLDKDESADGRPYFVMELVDGETLRSQIPSGGMDLKRAATILRQIGAALEQAHRQGVFHRDLKPENIMLKRGTDDVVLIDFGIAKVKDSVIAASTADGASAGTVVYMTPEQLRGERVTAASDIYSMGVVAYEMVTGQRPFNPRSPARLLELQKKGVPVNPRRLREDLSKEAEAIILRALSFEPSRRYEHATEFGDSLANALNVPQQNPPRPEAVRRALLILIALALIAFVIYWLIDRPREREPNRSFSYFLNVQRMRDGKPYGPPFKSHGEEKYENGDTFQLTVSTPVSAFVYVFHEASPKPDGNTFRMIFPNQAINNGSPSLGANQSVQSDWLTFTGPAGAENFWIVWSTSPVSELEAVTNEAFKHPDRGLTGPTLAAVKQYLTAKKAEIDATTHNYNSNQTAVVRARRDLLVVLAEFKHR